MNGACRYRKPSTPPRDRGTEWINGVEFVADFHDVGGGYGGYNQDHEFFGYRQAI